MQNERWKDHPCFSESARHTHSRVHLPVAPRCNMQCNYCNRQFDCINESRPGVTSGILKPRQALEYLKDVSSRLPSLSVVGIAGPGDPFANTAETLETLSLVREAFPDIMLCVATNGLDLLPAVPDLAALQTSHVTVTLNAVDPEIGSRVYSWMRYGGRVHRGREAAEYLLERQLAGIQALKDSGIVVKINTIVIPGVNDHHIPVIAERLSGMGVDLLNCMSLYPNKDTAFEHLVPVDETRLTAIRSEAGKFIPQMTHCQRCRADAAGLIGDGVSLETTKTIQLYARSEYDEENTLPVQGKIAVASREGFLVNQHMGEAERFFVYSSAEDTDGEIRLAPVKGTGDQRWMSLAEILSDCSVILTSGAGERPICVLKDHNITVHVIEGLIQDALKLCFAGKPLSSMAKRQKRKCGEGCSGTGGLCG